jgi:hypothetical protein
LSMVGRREPTNHQIARRPAPQRGETSLRGNRRFKRRWSVSPLARCWTTTRVTEGQPRASARLQSPRQDVDSPHWGSLGSLEVAISSPAMLVR